MTGLRDVQKTARIRKELMRLLGNVILLRDEHHPDKFYPRFELFKTASFHAFDPSKHGLLRELHDGYFYTNHDTLWAQCGRRTLPALMESTEMLICGEDLGFVPSCVPSVMHELGIIGLRIQRMPGVESPEGKPFLSCSACSICTYEMLKAQVLGDLSHAMLQEHDSVGYPAHRGLPGRIAYIACQM